LTAIAVAFGRGVGTSGRPPDPLAAQVLPGPVARALGLAGAAMLRPATRAATLGLVDHVCLRTAAIDAAVCDAVDRGCSQLVILGAGLDTRAWRMHELAAVDVFEVDHPSTQQSKAHSAARMPARARTVQLVAVDFERERVGARLDAEGHDASRPTVWIWEGVTPYLHHEAIRATLGDVATRSAPDSRLLMTYATPGIVELPVPGLAAIARLAFAGLGEALHGAMTPADAAAMLDAHGFAVRHDTDARQWRRHGPGSPLLARPFRAERLVVAARD
jgi:methyltransferase (TIGR00027 family)